MIPNLIHPKFPSTSDNNIFQGDLFSGSKTFFTHDILSTWMCECRWGMFSPPSSWLPIPMTVFLMILSVLPCQRNQKIMSWISFLRYVLRVLGGIVTVTFPSKEMFHKDKSLMTFLMFSIFVCEIINVMVWFWKKVLNTW